MWFIFVSLKELAELSSIVYNWDKACKEEFTTKENSLDFPKNILKGWGTIWSILLSEYPSLFIQQQEKHRNTILIVVISSYCFNQLKNKMKSWAFVHTKGSKEKSVQTAGDSVQISFQYHSVIVVKLQSKEQFWT